VPNAICKPCRQRRRNAGSPIETTDMNRRPEPGEQAWSWRGRIDVLITTWHSQRSPATGYLPLRFMPIDRIRHLAPLALTRHCCRAGRTGGGNWRCSSVPAMFGNALRTATAVPSMQWSAIPSARAEVRVHGIVEAIFLQSVRTSIALNALKARCRALAFRHQYRQQESIRIVETIPRSA